MGPEGGYMGSHVMMYGFKDLTEEPVADYIATLSVGECLQCSY